MSSISSRIKRENSKTIKKLPPKNTNKIIKKTKDTKDNESISDFEDKIEEIRDALRENYIQQKRLMGDLKDLMTLHNKEIKIITKMKKGNSGKLSGFNKPEKVPESLRDLLDLEDKEIARSKVTKILYKYFEDNNMYDEHTKKQIIPNKEIRQIFGMKKNDMITFYNLQTWLKKVYDEDNNSKNKKNTKIINIDD